MRQRDIFFFWLPLAFSWLLMTFEGPWVQGVISRKPDAELQLAAFGLIMSLSVTIEAPVIMMLATSSALAKNRQSYAVLWRYGMAVNLFVTVVSFLMAFTPLLDLWMGGVLNIPQNIIDATRPGMGIMFLWSAFIGYRRFLQGVIIRSNHTRLIGYGTVIRIIISAGVAVLLGIASQLPGAVIGAMALMASVTAELIYTIYVARPDIKKVEATEPKPGAKPLTYRATLNFHLPLAVTSLITLLIRPVIERGLAGTPDATLALAAWPVVFAFLLVMRSGGLSYQEVVISLCKGRAELAALRRYTMMLAVGTSGILMLIAFTPLYDVYLITILDVPRSILPLVYTGTQLGLLLPFLTVWQSYYRALLMLSDRTAPIYQGMMISFGLTAVLMFGGIAMDVPGIPMAAIALTIGTLAEMVFLWWILRANQQRLDGYLQTAQATGD